MPSIHIWIFALLLPSLGFADVECQAVLNNYSAIPHMGIKNEQRSGPTAEVFFLGNGIGGDVFRIVPRDGSQPYIEKEYFEREIFENDRLAYEILHRTFGSLGDGDRFVHSVALRSVSDHLTNLSVESVEGRDMQKAINESSDIAVRKALRARLAECLKLIADEFLQGRIAQLDNWTVQAERVRLEDMDVDRPMLKVALSLRSTKGARRLVVLVLKGDNIILTPDNRLIIIDPS